MGNSEKDKKLEAMSLRKLAFDAIQKNDETLGDAVRNKILDVCGGEWDYYSFMDHKYEVFKLVAELMPAAEQASLKGKFDRFAEFHDVAMGDSLNFHVDDNKIYPVYTCSRGNGDIERHKITGRTFKVDTEAKAIKIYAELDEFMANRIDLGVMTDKAANAHLNYIGQLISDTIYNSYSSINTNNKHTGTFDASILLGIMENVKASTGAERLQIWGSTTALSNISDIAGYSDAEKEQFNGMGYYGSFRGADLIALPQAYRAGEEDEFAVNTDYIIILPANEKIVKVVSEGDVFVGMKEGMERNDLQTEILYKRSIGAAAMTVPDNRYGLYKFA